MIAKQIAGLVERRIRQIQGLPEHPRRAALANLRRGIGRAPGELPELWGSFLQEMPPGVFQPQWQPHRSRVGNLLGADPLRIASAKPGEVHVRRRRRNW